MAQKPALRVEVHARALRASRNAKESGGIGGRAMHLAVAASLGLIIYCSRARTQLLMAAGSRFNACAFCAKRQIMLPHSPSAFGASSTSLRCLDRDCSERRFKSSRLALLYLEGLACGAVRLHSPCSTKSNKRCSCACAEQSVKSPFKC